MTKFTFAGSRTAIAQWILDQSDLNADIITSSIPPARIDMDADDPWDWAIDRLVEELCTENRTWQPSSINASRPNPAELETKLRENEVSGRDILLELDDAGMKNDFEIVKLGHRAWLRDAIRILRLRSPTYYSYVQRHNMSIGSFQPSSHHSYSSPSLQAPNPIPIATQSLNSDQPLPMVAGLTLDHTDESHILDAERNPSDSPMPDEANRGYGEPTGDNFTVRGGLANDDVVEESLRMGNVVDDIVATQVNPEVTIVDVNGSRRKRLAPTLVTSTTLPWARSIPTNADGVINFNPQTVTTTPPAIDPETPSIDTTTVNTQRNCSIPVHSDEAVMFDLEKATTPPPPVHEPGKLYIGADDKKRLIPVVQPHPTVSEPIQDGNAGKGDLVELSSVLENAPADFIPSKSDIAGTKDGTANAQVSGYLNRKRFPVDDIFYDGIELRGNASLPEVTFEFDNPPTDIPLGRRIYVHNIMKRFLRTTPVTFSRKGQDLIALTPYSSGLRPEHSDVSFTLYRPVDGIIKATRESLDSWPELGHKDTVNKLNVIGQERQVTFNPPGPDMLMLHEKMASDDWDPSILKKYMNVEGGDEVLPIYGESDSDNEYDEQTLREMRKEKGEKAVVLEQQPRKSRRLPLSPEEVDISVDEGITLHASCWREKKLPKLQHRGYRLWRKSRKQKTCKQDVGKAQKTIATLNERLEKMRQAILKESWTSKIQVLKQATILEGTVFDREAAKWEIAILKLKQCPEKPPKAAPKIKTPKVISDQEGESIETDEESSGSGESLDDFIASEDSGGEEQHELNMADAEVTDDDEMTLSGASISESPITPTKKIKIFIKDSKFRSPSESASPEVLHPKPEESSLPRFNSSRTLIRREIIELSSDDNQVIYDLVTPKKKKSTLVLRHTPPKSSITIIDDDTGTPSPKSPTGIHNDPVVVGRRLFNDWESRKDRRGLLTAIFQKMVAELRRRVLDLFSNPDDGKLWGQINAVMTAYEIEDAHVSGMDTSLFELVKVVVAMYDIYVQCKYRNYNIPLRTVRIKALKRLPKHEYYEQFFRLCLEIASASIVLATNPPTPASLKTTKKRKALHVSDQEDDSETEHHIEVTVNNHATSSDDLDEDDEPISAVRKRRPQLISSYVFRFEKLLTCKLTIIQKE
jgi:hypothetical protein